MNTDQTKIETYSCPVSLAGKRYVIMYRVAKRELLEVPGESPYDDCPYSVFSNKEDADETAARLDEIMNIKDFTILRTLPMEKRVYLGLIPCGSRLLIKNDEGKHFWVETVLELEKTNDKEK